MREPEGYSGLANSVTQAGQMEDSYFVNAFTAFASSSFTSKTV